MNKLNAGLTISIVVTIQLTIFLSFATITNMKVVQGYNSLGWAYLYIYILIPTIVILFLILTYKYLITEGLKGLKNLKWNFTLISILIVMFLLTGHLGKFFMLKDKVLISIKNQMDSQIEILRVYGRHDLVELKDIKQDEIKTVEFRGKHIDYRTINYLENRVYLDIYSNREWSTMLIVDPWIVMTWDTLKVNIIKMDSIKIN